MLAAAMEHFASKTDFKSIADIIPHARRISDAYPSDPAPVLSTSIGEKSGEDQEFIKAQCDLLRNLTEFSFRLAHYSTALESVDRWLILVTAYEEQGSETIAVILTNKASILTDLGKYQQAEFLYREAMDIFAQHAPQSPHAGFANVLQHLGILMIHQGRYDEGVLLLEDALEQLEAIGGDGRRVELLPVLQSLGLAEIKREVFPKAEKYLRRAIQIARTDSGVGTDDLVEILDTTGGLHLKLGTEEHGACYFREAAQLIHKYYGSRRHPRRITILSNLAQSYLREGRFVRANHMLGYCLAVSQRQYGKPHPLILVRLHNMVGALRSQKRYQAAYRYVRCLLLLTKTLDPDIPEDALPEARCSLGDILFFLNRPKIAHVLFEAGLNEHVKKYGWKTTNIASNAINFANHLSRANMDQQAVNYAKKSIAAFEKAFNIQSKNLIIPLVYLSDIYFKSAQPKAALEAIGRAQMLYEANSENRARGLEPKLLGRRERIVKALAKEKQD